MQNCKSPHFQTPGKILMRLSTTGLVVGGYTMVQEMWLPKVKQLGRKHRQKGPYKFSTFFINLDPRVGNTVGLYAHT